MADGSETEGWSIRLRQTSGHIWTPAGAPMEAGGFNILLGMMAYLVHSSILLMIIQAMAIQAVLIHITRKDPSWCDVLSQNVRGRFKRLVSFRQRSNRIMRG